MTDGEYVSGEEHRVMHASSQQPHHKNEIPMRSVVIVVAVIILCGLSFLGGVSYQKHHAKTTTTLSGRGGLAGGGFGRRQGGFGQVTAVSGTSITIQNQRTGNNNTYSITGSTTITDNGQTVPASDIQTGDTVIVTTSGSGSTTATRILVNPSFGGGQPQPSQVSPDSVQTN